MTNIADLLDEACRALEGKDMQRPGLVPEMRTTAALLRDESRLVALAIEHGFGTEVEEYPDGALWFDTNPLPMLRALIGQAETGES